MPDLGRILDMLERDGALDLRPPEEPHPHWPTIEPDEEHREIDFTRLFPRRTPIRDGESDYDLFGDEWEIDGDFAAELAEQSWARDRAAPPPGWDVWAWYQPIHYFGPDWGIFIREAGLLECARRIARSLLTRPYPGATGPWAKAVLRAAFAVLFLHEQYHLKTESLALRLHVVERRPVYPKYHEQVYRATAGTKDQIEEGLANADSYRRMSERAHAKWTGRTITAATRRYLRASFHAAPPGYANAARLLRKAAFEEEQAQLFARVQEASTFPMRPNLSEFAIATHLNHSLFRVADRIWTIIPRGGSSVLPTLPPGPSLPSSGLADVLLHGGWREVESRQRHQRKFRNRRGQLIILPRTARTSAPVSKVITETLGLSASELQSLMPRG